MNFPTRFYTGVRNTTIPNPAWLHNDYSDEAARDWLRDGPAETFEGLCSEYDFRLQAANFIKLQAVLQRNGTDFLYVAAARYKGDQSNHRFVACSADGSLLWNKYVAYVAQGGQNHVYVAGMRVKTSIFLALPTYKQDALVRNSKLLLLSAFGTGPAGKAALKKLDESRDLWN